MTMTLFQSVVLWKSSVHSNTWRILHNLQVCIYTLCSNTQGNKVINCKVSHQKSTLQHHHIIMNKRTTATGTVCAFNTHTNTHAGRILHVPVRLTGFLCGTIEVLWKQELKRCFPQWHKFSHIPAQDRPTMITSSSADFHTSTHTHQLTHRQFLFFLPQPPLLSQVTETWTRAAEDNTEWCAPGKSAHTNKYQSHWFHWLRCINTPQERNRNSTDAIGH